MSPFILTFLTLLSLLASLTTAYHLDASTLHPPGTPMTQYTPINSLLKPSLPFRPWLTTLGDNGRDIPQPSWYRPHPHATYHNTTYHLNQDATPEQFKPEQSEFDDPRYIYAFLDDIEKEQERSFLMTQVDDLDSLPPGAKVCLAISFLLFTYLILDAFVRSMAEWWLDSAEARAERKKRRGKKIVPSWYKRYSLIGAVKRWNAMTEAQMGINPGGPNSQNRAHAPPPLAEMPMMTRFETTAVTRTVETVRTERHVPYSAEAIRQKQEEINPSLSCEAVVPHRRPFGGMPGSPLWIVNQARRAFRGKG